MQTSIRFPILEGEIAKRGIMKLKIAQRLHISYNSLYSKLKGATSFTWEEACTIQEIFFPDMEKDILFKKDVSTDKKGN